jgi:hypothetical protein
VPQLRIHFTDADVARTRLKLEMDLMWEVVSSVQVLQHADDRLSFDPWRRQVRKSIGRDGRLRAAVQSLMVVAPHAAYFPDFLTPTLDTADIGLSADAILSAPARRVYAEVNRVQSTSRPAAQWLDDLAHTWRRGRLAARTSAEHHHRRRWTSVSGPGPPGSDTWSNLSPVTERSSSDEELRDGVHRIHAAVDAHHHHGERGGNHT